MHKKILLIEDQSYVAELYLYHLEKAGFEVTVAQDGIEGLKRLKEKEYDLILLDIMLPGLNGLELLKSWKSENTQSKTPIIVITNLAQDEIIKKAFSLGARGYLIKATYTPQQIVKEINNFIEGQTTDIINTTPPAD